MEKQYFLATTALEDFWDTSKPMLFLGEWCVLYEREKFFEDIESKILSSPFEDAKAADAASFYVDDLYENVLAELATALNVIHGRRYSLRYWRILIGPWLLHFIPAVYDRYRHIRSALEENDNFTTIVLSEKSFANASDTWDFAVKLSDDLFNLQIYSQIFKFLGKEYPEREKQSGDVFVEINGSRRSFFKNVILRLSGFYISMCSLLSRSIVVFTATSFSKKSQASLAATSFGRIVPIERYQPSIMKSEYDKEKRNFLKNLSLGNDEFCKYLEQTLFSDVPRSFIEDFESINKGAMDCYPRKPSGILSANAWFYDEFFKFWAGDCAEQGCYLMGIQHGGDYGAKKFMLAEKHELSIVNYYYSWGWNWGSEKLIPMPADKFINSNIETRKLKKDVLFVISSSPRYLIKFPYFPRLVQEYMDWQKRFIVGLCGESRLNLKIRPHRDDYGWSIVKRLDNNEKKIEFSPWEVSLDSELGNCRIFVCDHLSTTYLQALVNNIPTMLFWSSKNNLLKEEAQPYFDLLRDVGVLYDNPEDASCALNHIYDDVQNWWMDPVRQSAISTFCSVFARTEAKSVELWRAELLKRCSVGKSA